MDEPRDAAETLSLTAKTFFRQVANECLCNLSHFGKVKEREKDSHEKYHVFNQQASCPDLGSDFRLQPDEH